MLDKFSTDIEPPKANYITAKKYTKYISVRLVPYARDTFAATTTSNTYQLKDATFIAVIKSLS